MTGWVVSVNVTVVSSVLSSWDALCICAKTKIVHCFKCAIEKGVLIAREHGYRD